MWFSIMGFLPFSFTVCTVETVRGCVKKYKSQGKAVEVTVNCKEENSEDFCLDFFQEFGLGIGSMGGGVAKGRAVGVGGVTPKGGCGRSCRSDGS